MARNPEYPEISTPGQIPKFEVGFSLLEGDSIDPAQVAVSSSIPDYLTADNIAISAEVREVDGVSYPAGHVLEFTIICAANAPISNNREPAYLYIDCRSVGNPIPERLDWQKRIDVYRRLPMD